MRCLYWDKSINLGDTANQWLWRRLRPDLFASDAGGYLAGIGTLLFHQAFFREVRNTRDRIVVFGTGYRKSDPKLQVPMDPDRLDIRFVRGPLTARALQIDPEQYAITDAAYCLLLDPIIDELRCLPRLYDITVIPHTSSKKRVFWSWLTRMPGVNVLLPNDARGVEYMLSVIAQSRLVVAEAMHGAIFADMLRVPWVRFSKLSAFGDDDALSQFKWLDWLLTIGKGDCPAVECYRGRGNQIGKFRQLLEIPSRTLSIAKRLREIRAGNQTSHLSDEHVLNRLTVKLAQQVQHLN